MGEEKVVQAFSASAHLHEDLGADVRLELVELDGQAFASLGRELYQMARLDGGDCRLPTHHRDECAFAERYPLAQHDVEP